MPCEVFGFLQWDKVASPDGQVGFVTEQCPGGYFAVPDPDGCLLAPSISYKKLRLAERSSTLLAERRQAVPSPQPKPGIT